MSSVTAPRPPIEALCIDRDQVAAACGVKPTSVSRLVRKGVIPRPIPGTRLWSWDHLREHLHATSKGGQDELRENDDDWSLK
jgi:hypothetical protein